MRVRKTHMFAVMAGCFVAYVAIGTKKGQRQKLAGFGALELGEAARAVNTFVNRSPGSTAKLTQFANWTPSRPCCEQNTSGLCDSKANRTAWQSWTDVGYSGPDSDFRYQLRIVATGSQVTVQARGDLDCDGKYSLFESDLVRDAAGSWSVSPQRYIDETE